MHHLFVRCSLFVAMVGHALLGCPAHHAHGGAEVHCHHAVVHCHDHDASGRWRRPAAAESPLAVAGQAWSERQGCCAVGQPRHAQAPSGATLSTFSLPQQESRAPEMAGLLAIECPIAETAGTFKARCLEQPLHVGFATGCPASCSAQQWLSRWLA